jgi:hypothetical protein
VVVLPQKVLGSTEEGRLVVSQEIRQQIKEAGMNFTYRG